MSRLPPLKHQVTAVKALLKMRRESTEQIMREAEQAHRNVENLMRQANPSPADVGAAHLAAQSTHQRLMDQEEKFRTDFKALLNAEQRAQLALLNTAADQMEPLQMLGVLDGSGPGIHCGDAGKGARLRDSE
jgi:hypothetical protein